MLDEKKRVPEYIVKTISSSGVVANRNGDGTGSGWSESTTVIERDGVVVYDSRKNDEASIEEFLCREFGFRRVTVKTTFSETWE